MAQSEIEIPTICRKTPLVPALSRQHPVQPVVVFTARVNPALKTVVRSATSVEAKQTPSPHAVVTATGVGLDVAVVGADVGAIVAMGEGANDVGAAVVGAAVVGATVGAEDDGAAVPTPVGEGVGCSVGAAVGAEDDGAAVPTPVGEVVGCSVGDTVVGWSVGDSVGAGRE